MIKTVMIILMLSLIGGVVMPPVATAEPTVDQTLDWLVTKMNGFYGEECLQGGRESADLPELQKGCYWLKLSRVGKNSITVHRYNITQILPDGGHSECDEPVVLLESWLTWSVDDIAEAKGTYLIFDRTLPVKENFSVYSCDNRTQSLYGYNSKHAYKVGRLIKQLSTVGKSYRTSLLIATDDFKHPLNKKIGKALKVLANQSLF